MVYELVDCENETVCRLIQNSRKIYPKTMKLNLFKNHFSYYFNFEKYCTVYHCPKCDVLWYHQMNYNQHLKHCNGEVKCSYKAMLLVSPLPFLKNWQILVSVSMKMIFFILISLFSTLFTPNTPLL